MGRFLPNWVYPFTQVEELDRSKCKDHIHVKYVFKLDYIFIDGQKMFRRRSIKPNSQIVGKLLRVEAYYKYRLPTLCM